MITFIRNSHFSIRNSVDFLRPLRHSYFSTRNRELRSALETLSAPADAKSIAKLFKRGRKDRIEAILESLQVLGHAHEVADGWYSA